MERPKEEERYLARFSVFLTAARMDLSTSFWSDVRASGRGSRSLGLPSAKNSSSADLAPFLPEAVKYASVNLSSSCEFI